MKSYSFVCLAFLGFAISAHAQNVDFYGNPVAKDVCAQYGMKDDKDAMDCMDKICNAAGIPNNFFLLPCPNVDNCFALYKDGVAYIVYDIAFFNKVKTFGFTNKNMPKNNVDWAALTVLAHELGHHLCQHTTNKLVREKYTPVQMELQADEFAGTILYKLGATLAQSQQAMNSNDVPEEASLSHPGRQDRLNAIAKGYNSEAQKYAFRNGTQETSISPNTPGKDYDAIKNQLKQADDYCQANNYGAARDIYKNMDEADLDSIALDNLGDMYLNGYSVTQDYAQAKKWYEKAADKGIAMAMNNLGYMYDRGLGVPLDYTMARNYYEKAADKGEPLGCLNMGIIYENGFGVAKDYGLAKAWYEKAANKGNAMAMDNIGFFYLNGYGVPLDFAMAKTWIEKAAKKGLPTALENMGSIYLNGWGVAKNYALAKTWLEKAANAGNAPAMADIGDLYAKGQGVVQDYTEAKIWYDKACNAGSESGCNKAKEVEKKL